MCSSIDRCLLTRRHHINIHVCSLNDCCRGKLLKSSSSRSFDTVSVSPSQLMCQLGPRSRRCHCCCRQACFSSSHDLVGHFRRAAPCLPFFCLRSSCEHTCKSRQCLFIEPEFPSYCLQLLVWTRLADKVSSSITRIIAVRRRCSMHHVGRSVGFLSARSNVALTNRNTGVANGLRQAST